MVYDKATFLRVFANLPIPLRQEIIYVDASGRPISWDVAYLEIENNTPLGKDILERLTKMHII